MSSYVKLCQVMLCYVMLCSIVLSCVKLCYDMSCHVMSYHIMLCYFMLCCVVSCCVMSCHMMSCHVSSNAVELNKQDSKWLICMNTALNNKNYTMYIRFQSQRICWTPFWKRPIIDNGWPSIDTETRGPSIDDGAREIRVFSIWGSRSCDVVDG